MEVRFQTRLIEDLATRLCESSRYPPEVIKEIQSVVFWMKKAVADRDLAVLPHVEPFVLARSTMARRGIGLGQGYSLAYEIDVDQVTVLEVLYQRGVYEQ